MTLRELLEALPPGATVPVGWVLEKLDASAPREGSAPVVDLTAEEVAELFDRTPACVRGWARQGKLPGAYRLHGREWRIPRAALEALRGETRDPQRHPGGPVDLGSWRREVER